MKRTIMLFAVLCALLPSALGQTIKASPLEGHWVWDGKGEDAPDALELNFFGNVMLIWEDDNPKVWGANFTFDGGLINCGDDDILWQYRIAGNVLTIITEYDEQFSYTKAKAVKGPLEGIWRVSEYNGDLLEEDGFILFTRDIMAMGVYGTYEGGRMAFSGKYIYPAVQNENQQKPTEEELAKNAMRYSLKGKNLILSTDEDENELKLVKVY